MWANLHLLFWLSLVPFVTGGWARTTRSLPTALYGVVLLMAASPTSCCSDRSSRENGPQSVLAEAMGSDRKGMLSLVAYVAAIALAFVSPLDRRRALRAGRRHVDRARPANRVADTYVSRGPTPAVI